MTPTPSTIYVDDRERLRPHPHDSTRTSGVDMLSLIRSHRTRPTTLPKHLPAGDFCFTGEGPDGPCLVGIERKTVKGLLSDIRSGRFSGEQLPKLLDHYEFVFIVLEGRYRANWTTGLLEEKKGRDYGPVVVGTQTFVALELEAFLNTLSMCTPIREVRHTHNAHESAEYVIGLHHSFSKPWDKHSAHVAIHRPQERVTVGKASTVRKVAYSLDGLGWEKSLAIDKAFNSVAEMCEAAPKDFEVLPGFGPKISKKLWDQLHGRYNDGRIE